MNLLSIFIILMLQNRDLKDLISSYEQEMVDHYLLHIISFKSNL